VDLTSVGKEIGMMIPPFVGQEGGGVDWLMLLLPILVCFLCMGQSQGGSAPQKGNTETESWYTPQGIDEAYAAIVAEATEWRRKAEEEASSTSESITSKLRGIMGGGRKQARFEVKEEMAPRLYRMTDRSGPVYFELTEVEEGGTVVKATYDSSIKARITRFKAEQPLKIPAIPVSKRCQVCSKPVLPEFVVCPYCGEKLHEE
jgi:hypothetical protein